MKYNIRLFFQSIIYILLVFLPIVFIKIFVPGGIENFINTSIIRWTFLIYFVVFVIILSFQFLISSNFKMITIKQGLIILVLSAIAAVFPFLNYFFLPKYGLVQIERGFFIGMEVLFSILGFVIYFLINYLIFLRITNGNTIREVNEEFGLKMNFKLIFRSWSLLTNISFNEGVKKYNVLITKKNLYVINYYYSDYFLDEFNFEKKKEEKLTPDSKEVKSTGRTQEDIKIKRNLRRQNEIINRGEESKKDINKFFKETFDEEFKNIVIIIVSNSDEKIIVNGDYKKEYIITNMKKMISNINEVDSNFKGIKISKGKIRGSLNKHSQNDF